MFLHTFLPGDRTMLDTLRWLAGLIPAWGYCVLGVIAFYAFVIHLWSALMRNARELEEKALDAPDSPRHRKNR